jgi:transcription elongation factor GreA
MSDNNPVYLTREGLKKMTDELRSMKTKERTKVAAAIAEAREKGDLSENAEYDAAKDAQGHLEARIAKLEQSISVARIVDESQIDPSKALILSNVTVLNSSTNSKQTFKLVAAEEASFAEGKISVSSPIGKGLLGKSVGDKVDIPIPAGKVTFEIVSIDR